MKKLLLIFTILIGLTATAQTQLQPINITNAITQDNDATNDYLFLVAGVVTDTVYGKHCNCDDYFIQQAHITTENDFPTVVEVTRDLVVLANMNVNIGDNVILITNNSVFYSDGEPFEASTQTTITFTENCNSYSLLGENAQVFNTIEDYNETLNVTVFDYVDRLLLNRSYEVSDDIGRIVYRGVTKPGELKNLEFNNNLIYYLKIKGIRTQKLLFSKNQLLTKIKL